MDYQEFKSEHRKPDDGDDTFVESIDRVRIPIERAMIVLGPKKEAKKTANFSNLDAGLCPHCSAMVKEVAPASKIDFRVVYYVCVENEHHRFIRPEPTRQKPSQVQIDAWKNLERG